MQHTLGNARYKYFLKKGHLYCIKRHRRNVKTFKEVEKVTSVKSKGLLAKLKGTVTQEGRQYCVNRYKEESNKH